MLKDELRRPFIRWFIAVEALSMFRESRGGAVTKRIPGFVLLLMLVSGIVFGQSRGAAQSAPLPTIVQAPTADAVVKKALDAFGPQETLAKVRAILWMGKVVETSEDGKATFDELRVQVYPDDVALSLRGPAGPVVKLAVTPEFSYQEADGMKGAISAAKVEGYRHQAKLDPVYVAQHVGDYTLTAQGEEDEGVAATDVVKLRVKGVEGIWSVDALTGRLLSVKYETKSGEVKREYSDYRLVGGMYLPFQWETTEPGRSTTTTISKYVINPDVDGDIFQPPNDFSSSEVSLRVLQTETVPHAQELGGDTSTNCQMSMATATPEAAASSIDDVPIAGGESTSGLRMTCNAWDTTGFFPRKLYAMLVLASDGKAYIIACDQTSRWAKCAPLEAGHLVNAKRTDDGFDVLDVNVKGKGQDVVYSIVQTQPLP